MSALVLTESPEAIVIVRRREGLTAAGGSEVTAGLGAAAGEAGAGVLVVIGKGRRGTGHSGVLMKSGPGEETPETMVTVNTEETVHREHPGGRGGGSRGTATWEKGLHFLLNVFRMLLSNKKESLNFPSP